LFQGRSHQVELWLTRAERQPTQLAAALYDIIKAVGGGLFITFGSDWLHLKAITAQETLAQLGRIMLGLAWHDDRSSNALSSGGEFVTGRMALVRRT
jgi:hypothetical protein